MRLGKYTIIEIAWIGIGIIGIIGYGTILMVALLGDVDYQTFEETRVLKPRMSRVKQNGCHEGSHPGARFPRQNGRIKKHDN